MTNLARGKTVYASTYSYYPGSNAVDGNYDNLARTLNGSNWMVFDLGDLYRVEYVILWSDWGYDRNFSSIHRDDCTIYCIYLSLF